MERRLGRGLDSLLGGTPSPATEAPKAPAQKPEPKPAAQPQAETQADPAELANRTLPITAIRPNPNQPRKVFETEPLESLRDSIRKHGVLQPICVRTTDQGYEIVAGERRWRAARMAGLEAIPATVLGTQEEEQILELALVENLQREDLDPIEKARAFKSLQDRFGMTQEKVAEQMGMKRATVANHLRLLDLPSEAQDAVTQGLITMGHARALAGIGDETQTLKTLAKVIREEHSVRQLERLLQKGSQEAPAPETPRGGRIPAWVRDLEGRMRDQLGTRVSIQNRSGYKGQIVIRYHDREELDRLTSQLAPKDEIE